MLSDCFLRPTTLRFGDEQPGVIGAGAGSTGVPASIGLKGFLQEAQRELWRSSGLAFRSAL